MPIGPSTEERLKAITAEAAAKAAKEAIKEYAEKGLPLIVPKTGQPKIDPWKLIVSVCNFISGEITKRM